MKVGIALSGGGARGIVHIGALQALKENEIIPDLLAGTSAGSLAGAFYASGASTEKMMDFVKDNSLLKLFSFSWAKGGITDLSNLRKKLTQYLDVSTFEELAIPLTVAISNLNTGKVEYVSEGPLLDVITASCSIPVIFKPLKINGSQYVDGGLLANAPVKPLIRKSDFIIGINLVPRVDVPDEELSSILQVAQRCFDLAALNNIKPQLELCDMVIEPKNLKHYDRFNVNQMDELYLMGYDETMKMMPDIKHKMYLKS